MRGSKPSLDNVVPMKGDMAARHIPEPLPHMAGRSVEVWKELAPLLVAKDRLDPLYLYQFASYCEAVANFIDATYSIGMEGMYYEVETRNGRQQKATAASRAQQEAMNQMRRDSALFGLSPVDAARISAGAQGDLFEDIMRKIDGTD
ncbi:P27 family phage terminase small subunit [Paracoccus sp. Z330]|uniref:P27 family phage terminase small subunit n=1 Tax=Paracoccus onchidii TaxID=3017813 RepID=A0ABT4ZEX8_9RHOB|nr:P27 family phage terminase small subunit [Paracoccus onchidii]MDB6177926.1 P27 family phage terminase small subunit [Paracoccus onchidii]